MAAMGYLCCDSVGKKVSKEVLRTDFATNQRGSGGGIVCVHAFDLKRPKGPLAAGGGLTKCVPKVLVWPVPLARPPAATEVVDDFLIVNANFAVPCRCPRCADDSGKLGTSCGLSGSFKRLLPNRAEVPPTQFFGLS